MKYRCLKTEYVKGKDGEPLDIRSLTDKLPFFVVTQGTCSDGRYIYMIFERKQREGRTHRCKIVKLDSKDMSLVKVSGELSIGHGNDLTFRDGILYITHSASSLAVHRVNAVSLRKLNDIKVKLDPETINTRITAFNGISCFGEGFILRVIGSPVMLLTDSDFNSLSYFRTEKFYRTSQGIEQSGSITYRIYSRGQSERRNYLVTYDEKGNLIKRSLLEVTGEIEGIFMIEGSLYGTVYKKTKKAGGNLSFSAHIFRVLF